MTENSNTKKLVSIIICSRNRGNELEKCIPLVLQQLKEYPDCELIVVDNGSTDNTKEIVQDQISKYQQGINYVYEPIPGLCQARNRGRAEAKGEVLAYIDDDVILKDNWLKNIRNHFLGKKSDCLGGKVMADLEGEMPFEFNDSMKWFFCATNLGEQTRPLSFPEHPIGCNMAFTTEIFDKVGGFDTNLKLYADEKDFFRRVSKLNASIVYDPAVLVSQFIPADRTTVSELKSKSYKWGEGSATAWIISDATAGKNFFKIIEFSLRTAYMQLVLLFKKDFGRFYTYWYNRGYLAKLLKGVKKG